MVASIKANPTGIIAEFKRRSPSRGLINGNADVAQTVSGYARNGAAASSVLTDTPFFGGSVADLAVARSVVAALGYPLLRKEFIVAEEQIAEARVFGASALLLIASVLDRDEFARLASCARSHGLEILAEIHTLDELDRVAPSVPDMIGVNSRNLADMSTDVNHAFALGAELSARCPGALLIAESGIGDMTDIIRLRQAGYSGFLIGERFMREPDPAQALASFINPVNQKTCNI